jgi:hypothetical protein
MMAVDPSVRPAMSDVAGALQQLLATAPAGDNTTQVIREQTAPLPPLPLAAPTTTQLRTRRSRSTLLPLLILVLVLALGGIATWLLLSGNSDNGTPAAGQSNGPSVTGKPAQHSSSGQSSTSQNSPPNSPSPRSRRTTPPPATGGATAQELAAAVNEYFQLVPGNLDAAWDRLTPQFQTTRAGGRDNFDSYWNTVESVDVLDVSGQPPNGATATLLYHYKDGRDVTDQTTFTLVREDGVLKIDTES